MNSEQQAKLEKNVVMHGFGENILPELRENIIQGKPDFEIIKKGKMDDEEYTATLHFHREGKSGQVYFNSFDLALPGKDPDNPFIQTFDIAYKEDFTLREAYNLMKGRSVSKELYDDNMQLHKPWVKMIFTETNKHGNHPIADVKIAGEFDLVKELEKYPIRNWEHPDVRNLLIASLERGNLHEVAMDVKGKSQLFLIAANPETGGLDIYDKNKVRVPDHGHIQKQNAIPAATSQRIGADNEPDSFKKKVSR